MKFSIICIPVIFTSTQYCQFTITVSVKFSIICIPTIFTSTQYCQFTINKIKYNLHSNYFCIHTVLSVYYHSISVKFLFTINKVLAKLSIICIPTIFTSTQYCLFTVTVSVKFLFTISGIQYNLHFSYFHIHTVLSVNYHSETVSVIFSIICIPIIFTITQYCLITVSKI